MNFCPSGPNFLNAIVPKDSIIHSVLYSTSYVRHVSPYHDINPHLPAGDSLTVFVTDHFQFAVRILYPNPLDSTCSPSQNVLWQLPYIGLFSTNFNRLTHVPCTVESGKTKMTCSNSCAAAVPCLVDFQQAGLSTEPQSAAVSDVKWWGLYGRCVIDVWVLQLMSEALVLLGKPGSFCCPVLQS